MRARLVVPLDGGVVVIQRWRPGIGHYAVLPGGGVEPGETVEQAAVREAMEELGLEVELVRELATDPTPDFPPQTLFLARVVRGTLGTGTGEEYTAARRALCGTYTPAMVPVDQLAAVGLRPDWLVARIPVWLGEGG